MARPLCLTPAALVRAPPVLIHRAGGPDTVDGEDVPVVDVASLYGPFRSALGLYVVSHDGGDPLIDLGVLTRELLPVARRLLEELGDKTFQFGLNHGDLERCFHADSWLAGSIHCSTCVLAGVP